MGRPPQRPAIVVGEIIRAPVHEALAGGEQRDELTQLKGVGPKFADALHAHGNLPLRAIGEAHAR